MQAEIAHHAKSPFHRLRTVPLKRGGLRLHKAAYAFNRPFARRQRIMFRHHLCRDAYMVNVNLKQTRKVEIKKGLFAEVYNELPHEIKRLIQWEHIR